MSRKQQQQRPYPLMSQVQANLAQQIMAAEDQRVFDALDAVAQQCNNKAHAAYGKHLSECLEPDCVAAYIHES